MLWWACILCFWREREGLILESSNQMGETLNGTTGLDINNKARLIEEKLKELLAEETNEATITLAIKDFGIKRLFFFLIFLFP